MIQARGVLYTWSASECEPDVYKRQEETEKTKQLQDLLSLEKLLKENPAKEEKANLYAERVKNDGEDVYKRQGSYIPDGVQ